MKKKSMMILFLVFLFLFNGCKKEAGPSGQLSDIEGNTYRTIRIGDQVWMAENLRSTKLDDGTDITPGTTAEDWKGLTSPGYCWYNSDESNYKNIYGALYNGYTVSSGKICPAGWHIPAKEDWIILGIFLGDSSKAGGRMKEPGTEHWLSPNTGADNSSGFTGLPAGIRYFEGTFAAMSYTACFWTSTGNQDGDLVFSSLYYADPELTMSHRNKSHGLSIRCIRD